MHSKSSEDDPNDSVSTPTITLESARLAALRHGIDMRMFELRFEPGPHYGYISQTGLGSLIRDENGGIILTLQAGGLASEQDAVETIAHELNHVRGIFKTGFVSSEAAAEHSAIKAGAYFKSKV